jgi:hypothetical protein
LVLYEQLVRDLPKDPVYQWDLASCRSLLGVVLMSGARFGQAEMEYRNALAVLDQLVARFPDMPDYQNQLAATMVNLAALQAERKEFAAARRLLEDALPHHQAALRSNPKNPDYRAYYRNNRLNLAMTLLSLKDHAAAAAADQFLQAALDPAIDPCKAAGLLAGCVRLAEGDTRLPEAKRRELARAYGDRAVAALRQGIAAGYKDAAKLKSDSDFVPLRTRKDFQALLADLEAKRKQ